MEVFFVYLWLKLDALSQLFFVCMVVTGLLLLAYHAWVVSDGTGPFCADFRNRQESLKNTTFYRRVVWSVFLLTLFSSVLLPTTKETAVLVGTHYAVKLASSEEGAKVQSLIRKKANEYLDEQLKAPK